MPIGSISARVFWLLPSETGIFPARSARAVQVGARWVSLRCADMGLDLRVDRRHGGSVKGGKDDLRVELGALALKGFAPMALLTGVCLVAGALLAARCYADRWLWLGAVVAALITAARIPIIVKIGNRPEILAGRSGLLWISAYGMVTMLLCACMAGLTVYSFSRHAEALQILCLMGSFTICSGISSRIGPQPRVAQASIVILQGAVAYSACRSTEALTRFCVVLSVITAFAYCVSIQTQYRVMVDQIRNRRRLRVLAHHDSLTGLPNRHDFELRFRKVCADGTPFTLWILDLDGFKDVNDTYGHATGDEVLKQAARRLDQAVRRDDLVARFGGDEFVILQTDMYLDTVAREMAERMRREVSAPYFIKGHEIVIDLSAGIKISRYGFDDAERALLEADQALYRVKRTGSGGFQFA